MDVSAEMTALLGDLGKLEKEGVGIPYIASKYGKKVFDFSDDFMTVTIPYTFISDKYKNSLFPRVSTTELIY
jgi:hypothetical protein